jgi:hypothetical protein
MRARQGQGWAVPLLVAALIVIATGRGLAQPPGATPTPPPAASQADPNLLACGAAPAGTTSKAVLDAIQGSSTPRADLLSATEVLPAGGTARLVLLLPRTVPAEQKIEYRAIIQRDTEDPPGLASLSPVLPPNRFIAAPVPADPGQGTAGRCWPAGSTLIAFSMPDDTRPWLARMLWSEGIVHLFGCTTGTTPMLAFGADVRVPVSSRGVSVLCVVALLAALYLLLACASYLGDRTSRPTALAGGPWWRYVDPVLLTEGSNGKGSLSKLQILYFSFIVVGLLGYIVMRTGVLSDLSPTILTLLGISGVGAAASKATDVNRNRLDAENWAWLVKKRWLVPGGLAMQNYARWRDLVTSDGEFDGYRFQMLAFSLVVGGALLTTGLTDLASFEVPQTLLGILGLSQVVYIGGKLAAPPSCADLNAALTKLRGLEVAFREKVAAANAQPPPQALAAATALAPTEYMAFKAAEATTFILFEQTMGVTPAAPNHDPEL